jgi:hypothetical protein
MKNLRRFPPLAAFTVFILMIAPAGERSVAQSQRISGAPSTNPGKPVTIPLTIRVQEAQRDTEMQNIDLTVSEDGEPKTILSIRGVGTNAPITIAILIQEDLVTSIKNETRALANFVVGLPGGSRVMIGYIRTGSLQVKQKFTVDLEKAARAIRPPLGVISAAPYNPYVEVIEALKRFDSQPLGRRAILLISDGLDTSRGIDSSSPAQSLDLQRAINESQRRGVAVYGFYAPSLALGNNSLLSGNAQSSLLKLADDTGGHAYFQGTGAPVSFDPFIKDLQQSLDRLAALTFLSTHLNKGFHRIDVKSSTPGVRVTYPSGYVR